jgi:hypothetical protein
MKKETICKEETRGEIKRKRGRPSYIYFQTLNLPIRSFQSCTTMALHYRNQYNILLVLEFWDRLEVVSFPSHRRTCNRTQSFPVWDYSIQCIRKVDKRLEEEEVVVVVQIGPVVVAAAAAAAAAEVEIVPSLLATTIVVVVDVVAEQLARCGLYNLFPLLHSSSCWTCCLDRPIPLMSPC